MLNKFILSVIFCAVFFGASCLKKLNLKDEALGDSVAPEQIAAALGDGFGVIDYNDIKVNEMSSIVLSQTIQDGATQVLEQQDVNVLRVNNNATTLELEVLSRILKYSAGNTNVMKVVAVTSNTTELQNGGTQNTSLRADEVTITNRTQNIVNLTQEYWGN